MDLSFRDFINRIRLLLSISVFSGIAFGILIGMVGNRELFLWFNVRLTTNPIVSGAAFYLSKMGEWFPMLAIVLYSFRQSNKTGLIGLLIWLVGACFAWLFKLWLFAGKPRPYKVFSLENIHLNTVAGVEPHHLNTFPSGHTITAFYAVFLLAFVLKRVLNWQMIGLWILAFGCGLSRIILVQHWPEDVLGGMFLGIAAALLVIRVSYQFPEHPLLERSILRKNKG